MMTNTRKWYSEIVLLHCVGMLMILFAHIAHANGYMNVGELLITGVPLFLFVSGFLVGVKPVPHDMAWLLKKAKRILVPYYILLIVVLILYLLLQTEPFKIKQWIILFADLQGLTNFLFYNDLTGYYSPLAQGLGHFWFVTIIMLCYLLVPLFEKYASSGFWKKHSIAIIVTTVFVVQPVLLFYNVQISALVVFFLGYLFAKNGIEMTGKKFISMTLAMILLFGCRLIMRNYIDGTVIYNRYIANLSNYAIGLWIVALFFYLRIRIPKIIDGISSWRFVLWLESIIYEIYLVHHIIIKGSYSIYRYVDNSFIATIIVIMITALFSIVLQAISKIISIKIQ
mgnify:CR=1 FL=1